MYLPTKGTLKKKRSAKDLFDNVYAFFFLIFFIKAYVGGTHLNCINKSMQLKWVPTTYASLGSSVGCAVRLETRRSRIQSPMRLATFFRGD